MNLASENESLWKSEPSKILMKVKIPTEYISNHKGTYALLDLADPESFLPRLTLWQLGELTLEICDHLSVLGIDYYWELKSKAGVFGFELMDRRDLYLSERYSTSFRAIDFNALKGKRRSLGKIKRLF
jgi:hypothetical protein